MKLRDLTRSGTYTARRQDSIGIERRIEPELVFGPHECLRGLTASYFGTAT